MATVLQVLVDWDGRVHRWGQGSKRLDLLRGILQQKPVRRWFTRTQSEIYAFPAEKEIPPEQIPVLLAAAEHIVPAALDLHELLQDAVAMKGQLVAVTGADPQAARAWARNKARDRLVSRAAEEFAEILDLLDDEREPWLSDRGRIPAEAVLLAAERARERCTQEFAAEQHYVELVEAIPQEELISVIRRVGVVDESGALIDPELLRGRVIDRLLEEAAQKDKEKRWPADLPLFVERMAALMRNPQEFVPEVDTLLRWWIANGLDEARKVTGTISGRRGSILIEDVRSLADETVRGFLERVHLTLRSTTMNEFKGYARNTLQNKRQTVLSATSVIYKTAEGKRIYRPREESYSPERLREEGQVQDGTSAYGVVLAATDLSGDPQAWIEQPTQRPPDYGAFVLILDAACLRTDESLPGLLAKQEVTAVREWLMRAGAEAFESMPSGLNDVRDTQLTDIAEFLATACSEALAGQRQPLRVSHRRLTSFFAAALPTLAYDDARHALKHHE